MKKPKQISEKRLKKLEEVYKASKVFDAEIEMYQQDASTAFNNPPKITLEFRDKLMARIPTWDTYGKLREALWDLDPRIRNYKHANDKYINNND
jgi:hypothetical protein